MESNYNNENFERLLRESSDQYRMYPSESVWKNVYSALHTRRRWFGIGLILLLSSGFVTTVMMTNTAPGNRQTTDHKIGGAAIQKTPGNTGSETSLLSPAPVENQDNNDKTVLFQSQEPLLPENKNERPNDLVAANGKAPAGQYLQVAAIINTPAAMAGITPVITTNTAKADEPMTLVISDAATDQDSWILRNGLFLNNDQVSKKNPYKIRSAYQPLTIESVINSYSRRNKKLSFQFYFTPTISYRKLSENKSSLAAASSGSSSIYSNINNAVTHKPDMGIELGVAARYAIGRKIKLRGGLQFNTSRYDIKAFTYSAEVTTIALNTGNYTADSVNTISSYRNFNGYKSDWLHNFYFQISAPIGIEFKLAGDDKIQFGIGSSIQPTYILGDRAYLLSSNYKNYAEVPSLMRRWNMNASFEAFVSYSTGKMNWQVGPQIRYQLQSSFVKEYPVKENLFDFGLKIGVSANK